MKINRFTVDICEDCANLKGEMCHTPGCACCWRSISEVKELLSACLIRPTINGVQICEEICQEPIYEYDSEDENPVPYYDPAVIKLALDLAVQEAADYIPRVRDRATSNDYLRYAFELLEHKKQKETTQNG